MKIVVHSFSYTEVHGEVTENSQTIAGFIFHLRSVRNFLDRIAPSGHYLISNEWMILPRALHRSAIWFNTWGSNEIAPRLRSTQDFD